jgi:hypothetical protein
MDTLNRIPNQVNRKRLEALKKSASNKEYWEAGYSFLTDIKNIKNFKELKWEIKLNLLKKYATKKAK